MILALKQNRTFNIKYNKMRTKETIKRDLQEVLDIKVKELLADNQLFKFVSSYLSNGNLSKIKELPDVCKVTLLINEFNNIVEKEIEQSNLFRGRKIKSLEQQLEAYNQKKLKELELSYKTKHSLNFNKLFLVVFVILFLILIKVSTGFNFSYEFDKPFFDGTFVLLLGVFITLIGVFLFKKYKSKYSKELSAKVVGIEFMRQFTNDNKMSFSDYDSNKYIRTRLEEDKGIKNFIKTEILGIYSNRNIGLLNEIFIEKYITYGTIRVAQDNGSLRTFEYIKRYTEFDENGKTLLTEFPSLKFNNNLGLS